MDKEIEKKVDRILFILENDEATDKKGLVSRVSAVEQKLDKFLIEYAKDQAYRKGRNAVISAICGAVGAGLIKLISFLF